MCFLLVLLLFKMVLKGTAEMLPSVSKCKKAVTCLTCKIIVLTKLPSDMSYNAVGHEFN